MNDAAQNQERYCKGCGHLLRGIASRQCPECGREFDPNDPRTTDGARPWVQDRALAKLARGLIWGFGAMAAVCFATTLIGIAPIWVYLLITALAIVWVPSLLFLLGIICTPRVPLGWRARTLGVGLPILIFTIVWTSWPFRITFWFHRARLDAIAKQVEA